MPSAWFLCTYRQAVLPGETKPYRYTAMDDFTPQIRADGGDWSESEVLGNSAVVKVRASTATLAQIEGDPDFYRFPVDDLSNSLVGLSNKNRDTLVAKIQGLGYSAGEMTVLGDVKARRLGEVLNFIAQRRLKPRWDEASQSIKIDGPIQPVRPIVNVDQAVS